MVTEETLKTHEMELESRIRNLVWTVSGDYTLKLNPDVERYAKEPDTVLYDTIRQGAFSCYFDREAYSLYLVKKVYSGAAEGELMMLAQLVTEEAVAKRLESERPGVKGFRRRAAEEILDHSFETLSRNETGRLKLEYLRGRREEDEGKSPSYSGKTREWMELLKHASETADTMELIRVTDELYNKVVDPAFVKKHGDLASVLAVTIEELTEYSWKDFLSEELYEDGLETYLERVSLDMTNFTSKEAEEKKEKTAGSDTKKVVVVDEKALARMYQYIQRNYGKTWLSESEEKSRNYQLCRGIHSDCSLYYTEGVLKNPVGKYYQLSYAQKQKDKNLHAYYDQHRAVRQNISLLYQELKKAMLLQEDQSFADADHGILQPARMWKVGRSQNADLFRLDRYKEVITGMEGFGEKSYQNMMDSIETARHTTLPRLIYGLGIAGIGVANAKVLCRYFDYDLERMQAADEETLSAIPGVGEVLASTFTDYMRDAENLEKIAHLKEILTIETPQIDESAQTLAGMSFVVTGSLNHYASRNDLKEVIEEKGGKVTGSVTGKTTCLINNDITSTSSKNKKNYRFPF